MPKYIRSKIGPILLILAFLFNTDLRAECPFCTAMSGTISDEIGESKVAVMAKCLTFTPSISDKELHRGRFELKLTLKGSEHLLGATEWNVPTLDMLVPGETYLLVAFNCEPLEFGGPLKLSKIAEEYLKNIEKLPSKGRERLVYFLKFVELEDKVVADDAFNEFARASFSEVEELKPDLNRKHIIEVLRDSKTSLPLRRLFWSFLGLCGKPEDAELFHELRKRSQQDSNFLIGLEAAVASYISLRGKEGLSEIQRTILEDPKAPSADVYLTILAIRVHGEEIGQLSKKDLGDALKPVLKRSDLADQVLSDLTRWEDWSLLPELIELFKKSVGESETYSMRVPIIRYAMVCPLPEAKRAMDLFTELDPDAMRRAKIVFGVPKPMR